MPTSQTRALDKALTLLAVIAADRGRRNVSALAAEANLPPATAHRLIATLERRAFLTRTGRGRYLIGPALLKLSEAASLNAILEAAGRPIAKALARQTGFAVHLGVFEGDMVTYLVKAGPRSEALFTREGMQLEAYCSGIGKMLLALLPKAERARYLAGGPFIALTPNTITEVPALRAELSRTRARGYARDDGEIDISLRCIAAPVLDPTGAPLAALSLSGDGTRDPAQGLSDLHAAARNLAARLFPVEGTTHPQHV